MNQCIYTKESAPAATFQSREHVIPACIGGIAKLPEGYVSDAVNHRFSIWEKSFAREYTVGLMRMFFGPVGRRKHQRKERISVLINIESQRVCLGYLRLGKPFPIHQLHMQADAFTRPEPVVLGITLAYSAEEATETILAGFLEQLKQYGETTSPVIIKSDKIPQGERLLGYHNKCWYLGIPKSENGDTTKKHAAHTVSMLRELTVETILTDNRNTPLYREEQVALYQEMAFNWIDILRVYAKIAFNCLAFLKGRDYVLQEAFDPLRQAILTGEQIAYYVRYSGNAAFLQELFHTPNAVRFGAHLHMVLITDIREVLAAAVCLYGSANPVFVILAEQKPEPYGAMDGYVCDWENKRELNFISFVSEFIENGRPSE